MQMKCKTLGKYKYVADHSRMHAVHTSIMGKMCSKLWCCALEKCAVCECAVDMRTIKLLCVNYPPAIFHTHNTMYYHNINSVMFAEIIIVLKYFSHI